MEFRILGPLEVTRTGRAVDLGSGKQEALLAVLLLYAGEVVSAERLIDELWGEDPPQTAAKAIQGYVSALRKALESDAIVTKARGYLVPVADDRLDAVRFERLAVDGFACLRDDPRRASELLQEALALWRGDALEGVLLQGRAHDEVLRLAERRLVVLEHHVEARLALGLHAQLVGELQKLVAAHPFREALRAHLMLALYRSGRQTEALATYREGRRRLTEELGLEPSQALRRLEASMLAQAAELDLPPEVSAVAAPSNARAEDDAPVDRAPPAERRPDARRLVTVLAATASASDPEALHDVLDRCASVVERHGGALERFVGDTIAGLFGVTQSHEHDALRALEAAVELRDAHAQSLRIGVESGEVFVGSGRRGETLATGSPIVAAGGLAQTAAAGEILLGERIRLAAATAVRVDPGTGRLVELLRDSPAPARSPASPFVGRSAELATLRAAFARTCDEPTGHLVTIMGAPGIGKSRLIGELLATLREHATVLVGRCPPYGEGQHFAALAEIGRQLGDDPAGRVGELLGDNPAAAHAALGALTLTSEAVGLEEASWGLQKLLARLAHERPVVVVVEDIHWAEAGLLDLLEHVVAFSSHSPILLLCVTRPELLERRAAWAAPGPHRSLLAVEALAPADALKLVERLGAGELAGRIVQRAEGNPLFAEQLVLVGAQHGDELLPASIQSVLAARLDALPPIERRVLGHGAVEGRTFHMGALAALLAEEELPALRSSLVALVRKGLIRADRPRFHGEDAFRFDHALIGEAAYHGLPKRLRADLHERVAAWLERQPGSADEVIAHHLEQACRLPAGLGPVGRREHALAVRAGSRLQSAARAALARGDPRTASDLLGRTTELLERGDPARTAVLPTLGMALFEAGRLRSAQTALTEAVEHARDARTAARARVELQFVRLEAESDHGVGLAREVAEHALAVFEEHADEQGECRAWCLQATTGWIEGQIALADRAWERAARLADRTGEEGDLFEILGWRASATVVGPTALEQGLRLCEEIRERAARNPVALAFTLHPLAALHAMAASFDTARRLVDEGNEILCELGRMQSAVSHHEATVELLAGCPDRAEQRLREGYDRLAEMGDRGLLATTAAMLAQALFAQGRSEEAESMCGVAERTTPSDDVVNHIVWRGVRAKILAGQGEADAAQALAHEAVTAAARTDLLVHHGDALSDLAEVHRLSGRPGDAGRATQAAVVLYERKGNVVGLRRARSCLAQLTGGD